MESTIYPSASSTAVALGVPATHANLGNTAAEEAPTLSVRICPTCGVTLDPSKRSDARFCSIKCNRHDPDKAREYNRQYRLTHAVEIKKQRSIHDKLYYQAHKQKIKDAVKVWAHANRTKCRKYGRAWAARNPTIVREHQRQYTQEHPEIYYAATKKYRLGHPNEVRASSHRRRARKLNAPGFATAKHIAARMSMWGSRCAYCGGPYEAVDHVIALARGGTNWPSNLRPACKSCNSSKSDKSLAEWLPKRLKYLESKKLPTAAQV